MKEKIQFVACKVGERVEVGAYHWEIREWLANEEITADIEDGFTTTTWRFVARDEAHAIAIGHVLLPKEITNLEAGDLYAGTNECSPEKCYDEVERRENQ